MATETTYTLEQIKAAFWAEFHESGERWFSDLSGRDNASYTESAWEDFLEALEKVATGTAAHVDFTIGHHGQPGPEEVWRSVVERQKERIE